MFTGIITHIGEVIGRDGGRFAICALLDPASVAIGASIACDGCCLTVTTVRSHTVSDPSCRRHASGMGQTPKGKGSIFTVDVSNETLSRTTLGSWAIGRRINIERPLKAGDELGGHIVAGHVDGVARITALREDGESRRIRFDVPAPLARYIAEKGSVALDGTSLTVNEVEGSSFGVNLIPLTLTDTTWGSKKPGDEVNIEVDLFARYVARLMEYRS